jgi:hypothetical protein
VITLMTAYCAVPLAWADTPDQHEQVPTLPSVLVVGTKPVAASSEVLVPEEDFELRPQGRPSDLLRMAPGLFIAQHQGGGKAEQTFLRGFDNDHGTDIAEFVDGVPVNFRSHAHGQGYADLHFLIPETVKDIQVYKGPFQVEFGDFATSGAVSFERKEDVTENLAQTAFGPWDTQRDVTVFSPARLASRSKDSPLKTISAFELYHTDGPFLNAQKYDRFNTYHRLTYEPDDEVKAGVSYSYMQGTWHGSGHIPLREVEAGRLDRYGSVDPSEGGDTDRMVITADGQWRPAENQLAKTLFYAQRYNLDLFNNFTFFKDDPVNGDGIEQLDERYVFGSDTSYAYTLFPWEKETTATVGFQSRWDRGRVLLAHQQGRVRLEDTQDIDLSEVSYGPYLKIDSQVLSWLRAVGGSRFDFFHYDVNDRLGETLDGSKSAWIPSLKGALIFGPWWNTEFFANAASGFHSNDARDVILNPDGRTLPRAVGYELGVRSKPWERLELVTSVWLLNLQSELVFVGDDGTTEPKGPSRRYGAEWGARYHVTDWLTLNGELTLTKAYFTQTGEAVPLAPKLTARADATMRFPFGLESSLEMRSLGTRWAVEDRSWKAESYNVFDWTATYRPTKKTWNHLELFCSVENLFNANYREAQLLEETQLPGEPAPVTDITFTPGNPRTFLLGATVYF